MVEYRTYERTRDFPRDKPIDSSRWLEFTVVAATYRYWTIRFVAYEVVDDTTEQTLESPAEEQ